MISFFKAVTVEYGLEDVYIRFYGYDNNDYYMAADCDIYYGGSCESCVVPKGDNHVFNVVSAILEKIYNQSLDKFKYALPKNSKSEGKALLVKWNTLRLLKDMNERFGWELYTTAEIQKALAKCFITSSLVKYPYGNGGKFRYKEFFGVNGSEKRLLPKGSVPYEVEPKVYSKTVSWESYLKWNPSLITLRSSILKHIDSEMTKYYFNNFTFKNVALGECVILGSFTISTNKATRKIAISEFNKALYNVRDISKIVCI